MCPTGAQKLKKTREAAPHLNLVENPDILASVARLKLDRPQLVVGFAAETERVVENARAKLQQKNVDFIVANDVLEQGAGFAVDGDFSILDFERSKTQAVGRQQSCNLEEHLNRIELRIDGQFDLTGAQLKPANPTRRVGP